MNLFKRKKKRLDPYSDVISEQEYVDEHIKSLRKKIDNLSERVWILETMSQVDFIFMHPSGGFYNEVEKTTMWDKEAREWLRKNGYSYIKVFEHHGELWVKQEKAKK